MSVLVSVVDRLLERTGVNGAYGVGWLPANRVMWSAEGCGIESPDVVREVPALGDPKLALLTVETRGFSNCEALAQVARKEFSPL